MEAKDILVLVNAGFTKSEILGLAGQTAPTIQKAAADVHVPDQTQAEANNTTAVPVPEPQPEAKAQSTNVTLSDNQFSQLMQKLNLSNASIDVPEDVDISKKLGDHFSELLIGK